jgi:hypothetical protein
MTRTWKRGRRSMIEEEREEAVSSVVACRDCRRRGCTIRLGE